MIRVKHSFYNIIPKGMRNQKEISQNIGKNTKNCRSCLSRFYLITNIVFFNTYVIIIIREHIIGNVYI